MASLVQTCFFFGTIRSVGRVADLLQTCCAVFVAFDAAGQADNEVSWKEGQAFFGVVSSPLSATLNNGLRRQIWQICSKLSLYRHLA